MFSKNLISNPSGKLVYIPNGGNHNWPHKTYIGRLPGWVGVVGRGKFCKIDLWEKKLVPAVLKHCISFEISCSLTRSLVCAQCLCACHLCSRGDCGCMFRWKLQVLDDSDNTIYFHENEVRKIAGRNWETLTHSFKFTQENVGELEKMRYLIFHQEGYGNIRCKVEKSCLL